MGLIIRVNGYTPAWPVELGGTQTTRARMLLSGAPLSMANTAFSLILTENEAEIYHLLVDVGLGVVPALLQFSLTRKGFRPPDAVLLTHSHFDHIASLDWLVHSLRRHPFPPPAQPADFPVYCTQGLLGHRQGPSVLLAATRA
jgi:glyoxylase-like metal-dependent hydrolase (beta-lactamase superfamily II)